MTYTDCNAEYIVAEEHSTDLYEASGDSTSSPLSLSQYHRYDQTVKYFVCCNQSIAYSRFKS